MGLEKYFKADLHIHSCLSPCASEDMVPIKIIKKAFQEGLDLIAITDHNSILNVEAFIEAALLLKPNSVEIVPGIEVQSNEEVHMICLFENMEKAKSFHDYIESFLPNKKNRRDLFGDQSIVDSNGDLRCVEEKLLLNSLDLNMSEIVHKTKELGGISIAAHIDRPSFSLLSVLGFIPVELDINGLELSKKSMPEEYIKQLKLEKYPVICSSDAHYLSDIGKAYSYFKGEPSFSSLKEALKLYKIKRITRKG